MESNSDHLASQQQIRLSEDNTVLDAPDEETGERFANEVAFLEHFVPRLGRVLKMKSIRFGVIEDSDDQVAFRFVKDTAEIDGVINDPALSLSEFISESAWEGGGG